MVAKIKKSIKELLFTLIEYLSFSRSSNKTLSVDTKSYKKILIFEGGGFGDLLRILPVIDSFIYNFPDSSISLLLSPVSKKLISLYRGKDSVNEIIEYDYLGHHKSLRQKLLLITSLKKAKFDIIYSPDRGVGMRERSLMSFLIGASYRIGFYRGREGHLNNIKIEFKDNLPIALQNLSLFEAAGLKAVKNKNLLSIPSDIIKKAGRLTDRTNPLSLIVIHPGAHWESAYRCWPIERYISLINKLMNDFQTNIAIIGNTSESDAGNEILTSVNNRRLINLVGKVTLPETAGIIKISDLFIGNDSGPLHLAQTLQTPTVAIFGSTLPAQVIESNKFTYVIKAELPCSPCYTHQHNFEARCKDFTCLKSITVEDVIKGVEKMLKDKV